MNLPTVSLATKVAAGAVGLLIVGGGAAAVIHDRQNGDHPGVQAAAPSQSSRQAPRYSSTPRQRL